jgi:hypothetical protein
MDFVFWIIVIVLIVGIVWWLLNRNSTGTSGSAGKDRTGSSAGDGTMRADGALAGGSAAASAEAAATAGIPSAAGFGRAAEPAPPTTADEAPDLSGAAAGGTAGPAQQAAAASAPGPSEAAPLSDSRSEIGQSGSGVPSGRETEIGTGGPGPDDKPTQEGGGPQEEGRVQEGGRLQEDGRAQEDAAEWETQWSEASGSMAVPGEDNRQAGAPLGTNSGPTAGAEPVHHAEYTGPHSPTLPGAETAAGEGSDDGSAEGSDDARAGEQTDLPEDAAAAETLDRTQSSAAVETAASHMEEPDRDGAEYGTGTEPSGHLAVDQPYGEGSASPDSDGSGPADYTVKGDAAAMVYYEEGHPDYEQTRAEVWFESAAHAEAAGFRAPRRNRL